MGKGEAVLNFKSQQRNFWLEGLRKAVSADNIAPAAASQVRV